MIKYLLPCFIFYFFSLPLGHCHGDELDAEGETDSIYTGFGLCMLCLTPIIGGLAHSALLDRPWKSHFINSFAGGIIFGSAMLHLFPDSNELNLLRDESNTYPFNFLIAACVTYLLFAISNLVPLIVKYRSKEENRDSSPETVCAIAFYVALTIHGAFEGLATGSLKTSNADRWVVLGALFIHKIVEYASLASTLALTKSTLVHNWFMLITANIPCIVCFIISWAAIESNVWANALFASMSAGTFLYISLGHLVPESLSLVGCGHQNWTVKEEGAEKINQVEDGNPTDLKSPILIPTTLNDELAFKLRALLGIGLGLTVVSLLGLAPG